jgi:hypothetical protein
MIEGKYTEPDILKFKKDEVQKVIDYSKLHPKFTVGSKMRVLGKDGEVVSEDTEQQSYWYKGYWYKGYEQADSDKPTIRMVGDDGVYLMTGGATAIALEGGGAKREHPLAYAEGCNPKVDEFDDWWALKRATWGGDDGVESLIVDEIQPMLDKCKTHLIVAFKEEDGKDVFDITHD